MVLSGLDYDYTVIRSCDKCARALETTAENNDGQQTTNSNHVTHAGSDIA